MKTKKTYLLCLVPYALCLVFIFQTFNSHAQIGGAAINSTGVAADNSAMLDVSCSATGPSGATGSRQGILIPRVSLSSITDVSGFVEPLATSLMVYNLGTSGLSPAGFYYWNGSQWIQAIGPQGATGADGSVGATGVTGLLGAGSATGNTTYWDGSQWVTNSSNIYNAGGNVGIGTSTPSAKLEIVGSSISKINDGARITDNYYSYSNDAEPSYIGLRKARGSLSSPGSINNGDGLLRLIGLGYDGSNWQNAGEIYLSADGTPANGTVPGKITFYTTPVGTSSYPTPRMTILNGGNIGIGTTSPTANLDIEGKFTIAPVGVSNDNGYNGSIAITQSALSGQYINITRYGEFPWSIGTVYNTCDFAIGQGQATDANFTSPFFVINHTTGNVGIGTITPGIGYKLDVNGNANISGTLTVGGSTLASYTTKVGSSSRGVSQTGTQTIPHGLGKVPKLVTITAACNVNGAPISESVGTFDGTTAAYLGKTIYSNGNSLSGNGYIVFVYYQTSSYYCRASITVDATNITLTWSIGVGSPSGTVNFIWEAEG
ncbi:MAG: hypothetical protein HGB12_11070 [Bacteroidetes bacterium]|nr:hypothetical protein [Bacteroidota bacterium]